MRSKACMFLIKDKKFRNNLKKLFLVEIYYYLYLTLRYVCCNLHNAICQLCLNKVEERSVYYSLLPSQTHCIVYDSGSGLPFVH